jgi:hypothetical protein
MLSMFIYTIQDVFSLVIVGVFLLGMVLYIGYHLIDDFIQSGKKKKG